MAERMLDGVLVQSSVAYVRPSIFMLLGFDSAHDQMLFYTIYRWTAND